MTTGDNLAQSPVLIIGAGMVGLSLAHALKKSSIPFLIFERDPSQNTRPQGWALTIQFCLSELQALLPDAIFAGIDSTQVDPGLKVDNGNFLFLNLSNGEIKWRIPTTERKRVSRDRFRQLLLGEGMAETVLWGKEMVSFQPTETGIKAIFNDGSSYEGLLLVGVDGAASKVRSLVFTPETSLPTPLPVNFLGTSLYLNEEIAKPLLDIDPLLFQGCHPESSTYLWFSIIDSPETNGTISQPVDKRKWKVQVCLSWPSSGEDNEVPTTDAGRVAVMKERTADFDPRLKALFHDALSPDHAPVMSLKLSDWYPPSEQWKNLNGRVTLAGDAAHTMTMYRGEGFNHAIIDDYNLLPAIKRIYHPSSTISVADLSRIREVAIAEYERELKARGKEAVLMSREACLDAHVWDKLNENSAILRKRGL